MLGFIIFGCYFLLWILLDFLGARRRGKEHMRSKHVHHVLLGFWPFLITALLILLYGKTIPGYVLPLLMFLSGILYCSFGISDLAFELRQRIARVTPLTRVALFVPKIATIIGILGIASGLPLLFFGFPSHSGTSQGTINLLVAFVLVGGIGLATRKLVKNWTRQTK